MYKTLQS